MNVPLSANILEVEDILKGLPDEDLMTAAQAPTGNFPQYLVISEIQRRSDMRSRFAAEQEQPKPTIRDQIVNQGLGELGQTVAPGAMPPGAMPPGGMPPGGMPPGAMMPPPEAVSDPSQMMYAAEGGLVDVSELYASREDPINEEDSAIRLMDDLIGLRNRIPDSSELYASRGDPITEASLYGGSIPNAILEDARKFDPAKSLGMTQEELSVIQGTGVDLPEVLGYAGGGIVELQEGGPPEDDRNFLQKAGGWIAENPWEAASYASMAIPGIGFGGLALRGLGAVGRAALRARAVRAAQFPFMRPQSAEAVRIYGKGRGIGGLNPTKGDAQGRLVSRTSEEGKRFLDKYPDAPIVRGQYLDRSGKVVSTKAEAARELAPGRAFATTAGIGQLGTGIGGAYYGGDDAETGGGGELTPEQLAAMRAEQERIRQERLENNESIEPERGSNEWVQAQLLDRYDDRSGRYSQAVEEIMGQREERADLTERQAQSDMLTSMLMHMGAGTMSGDPGEGMKLAADAVNRIRETSGRDVVEQERLTQQLRLEGIDTEVAEEAALLSSMVEINNIKAQARRDNNADFGNALALIDSQINAMAAASMERGETMTKSEILAMQARAYRAAGIKYGYADILSGLTSSLGDFSAEEIN